MEGISFFDANVTVGPTGMVFRDQLPDLSACILRLGECGVGRALVHHSTSIEHHPAYGNSRLLEEIRGLPNAEPAWVMLPFTTMELGTPSELRRKLKENGIRAALLYPAAHLYSNAEWCCGDLYALLEGMSMPLFTRIDPPDFSMDELAGLLGAHSRLPVILQGVGYQKDRSLYRLLDRHDNLYVESGRYPVFRGIEEVVRLFGAERIVFGSGAPLWSPGAAVAAVLMSDIPRRDKELIAGGNLVRLLERIDYAA